ncbi:biotin transporter BioY [Cryptosporangium phraense]|uniref:Biotin transporter n=1 Tax=Cryptosporangium phraense TaxID=2593070 RepID=A0A545AHP3_9ACTN|nr:biotin transporter BioY [Cryptosporangium phraense]TQS40831.1 biotin transporter BioY [Cryptosporangium phraense]
MTTVSVASPRRVLADAIPGGLVRDAVLVVGSAAFVGLFAQISIPLSFTPVPVTGGTFAVLLSVAALGPARGVLGMLVYLLAGMAGVPWFSSQMHGWSMPSFGYIVGYVLAAAVVGALARRGADRTPLRAVPLMIAGNLAVYAIGVPWLMASLDVGLGRALALGFTPFVIGDALKIVLAAVVLPSAWALVHRVEK